MSPRRTTRDAAVERMRKLSTPLALTGNREHVYHAAMLDPHTAAAPQLRAEVMALRGDQLPEPVSEACAA